MTEPARTMTASSGSRIQSIHCETREKVVAACSWSPFAVMPATIGREDRIEGLVDLAQTARHFDNCAINAERGQRHTRRASDKTSQHDDVQPND